MVRLEHFLFLCVILRDISLAVVLIFFAGDMNRINEKIDHLGGDMQWMKDALIEWAQAIDNDDKTNTLIEKYCREDEKRADVSRDVFNGFDFSLYTFINHLYYFRHWKFGVKHCKRQL